MKKILQYYYIIYCNHCIQCLKRFFLMHHTMFQHAENSILVIIAYNTSNENSFWFIREGPNRWKTVFLQSLHKILQKNIRFDSSKDIPTWRKWYSAFVTSKLNSFWFNREGPNMRKTIFLQSLQLSPQN